MEGLRLSLIDEEESDLTGITGVAEDEFIGDFDSLRAFRT